MRDGSEGDINSHDNTEDDGESIKPDDGESVFLG